MKKFHHLYFIFQIFRDTEEYNTVIFCNMGYFFKKTISFRPFTSRNRIWLNILAAPVIYDRGVFYCAKEKF